MVWVFFKQAYSLTKCKIYLGSRVKGGQSHYLLHTCFGEEHDIQFQSDNIMVKLLGKKKATGSNYVVKHLQFHKQIQCHVLLKGAITHPPPECSK
jgi:hypothetical protein